MRPLRHARPAQRVPAPARTLASLASLALLLVVVPPAARPAGAQDGSGAGSDGGFKIAVFEGQGLGHGVGLPLDGAHHLALEEGEGADSILGHFFPGTGSGSGEGLVRVLLTAREDLEAGIDVVFPEGGTVRDGRNRPVAASFPLDVPEGATVRVVHTADRYRAEVLDGASITGTRELTPTSEGGADQGGEPAADAPSTTFPGLAASPHSLWLEPRSGGSVRVGDEEWRGSFEVVVEAQRLHLVAEIDVERYLLGVDLSLPDDTPLEPAAMEAAVIAARTYALRSARGEPKVGRFHLWRDHRSLPFGPGEPSAPLRAAVDSTKGRIRTADGQPAATLVTAGAAGRTAAGTEVFGSAADGADYLTSEPYEGDQEFRWRVDLRLDEVAAALGHEGPAESLEIAARTASDRPRALVVSGPDGRTEVSAPEAYQALQLPSSRFDVRVEDRTEALPARGDARPFQEFPSKPIAAGTVPDAEAPQVETSEGGREVPLLVAAGAGAILVAVLAVLGIANLQRRVRARRERNRALERHPTAPTRGLPPLPADEVRGADPDAPAPAVPATPGDRVPAVEEPTDRAKPGPLTTEAAAAAEAESTSPASSASGATTPRVAPRVEGPLWHNEPEWLEDFFQGEASGTDLGPDDVPPVDERTLQREFEAATTRQPDQVDPDDEEPPPTRSLREVLGWDDAPDWLDDSERDSGN